MENEDLRLKLFQVIQISEFLDLYLMLGFVSFKGFCKFDCSMESPSHLIFSKL